MSRKSRYWRMTAELILPIVLLASLLVRPFILEPFYIPSNSMYPLLEKNDRILVNKLSYRFGEPARSEVVVFYGAEASGHPEEIFVKRVVGLPGEEISIRDGNTYIEGMRLEEPYIRSRPYSDFGPVRVPKGQLFVMGDNRNDSRDSRYWGTIPVDHLIGHAVTLFWPPDRFRLLP